MVDAKGLYVRGKGLKNKAFLWFIISDTKFCWLMDKDLKETNHTGTHPSLSRWLSTEPEKRRRVNKVGPLEMATW